MKIGFIDRINDERNILVRDLFSKETSPDVFLNLKVTLSIVNITGVIQGTFGKSGKLKVYLESPLPQKMLEDGK